MDKDFYRFAEDPFFLTPDTRFLFLPENHQAALDSILLGINERKGFMVVIGEKGIGKTTLIHHLMNRFDEKVKTVFISQDLRRIESILEFIIRDLGLPLEEKSKGAMIMQLEEYIIQQSALDKALVMVIDNAQNLSREVIEEIRLLAGTDPRKPKFIQEIFVGNGKFEEMLNLNVLRQLKQRIAMRCLLQPFNQDESRQYIERRLGLAGSKVADVFSAEAVDLICQHSGGIPLLINLICHMALADGFALSKKPIDAILLGNVISVMDTHKNLQAPQKRKPTRRVSDFLTTRSLIMKIAYSLLIYSSIAWISFLLLSLGKP
jgi:general secretion pathway protein A